MSRYVIATSLLAITVTCRADDLTPDQVKFFETKIRPVLVQSCFECHSKATGQNEGGLTLDTKVGLRQGGNSGPGIAGNKLDESWIWRAVTHSDPDLKMPPEGKLPDRVVAHLKRWVEMGAPDPRDDGPPAVVASSIDIEQGRKFWSFQSPKKTLPPTGAGDAWSRTAIDQFVRATLDVQGMSPSAPADPATLLRRLHFDLVGLPPGLADLSRFQSAWKRNARQAIEKEVDRLLESQHFGERWGRHWLDVARFAESNGKAVESVVSDGMEIPRLRDRFVQQRQAV